MPTHPRCEVTGEILGGIGDIGRRTQPGTDGRVPAAV